MNTDQIETKARSLRTHTVTFEDKVQALVVVRALQGQSTKSIAAELGLTVGKTEYRIQKAQRVLATYFRRDFRNGQGEFAAYVKAVTANRARQIVRQQIAPKFAPLAANRAH